MVEYCKGCGNSLLGGDRFCRKCGARIVGEPLLVMKGRGKKARRIEAPPSPPVEEQPQRPPQQQQLPQPQQEKKGFFGGMFPKKPAPPAAAGTPQAAPAGEAKPAASVTPPSLPVVKPQAEGFIGEHRRRYLERRGELAAQAKQEMMQPVQESRKVQQEVVAPGPQAKDQTKGIDLSALSEVSSLQELESLENIEGLSSMEQSGDLSLEALAGLAEPETIPKERGMGCPHCASVRSSVVYCPYCGKGFCSNCANRVTPKGDLIFYECPVCLKEVIVKKPEQAERIAAQAR
ncbi:hypothetical protein HYS54_00675 [Candidatus Micrarchaeota archaeon]|nr:hypothetical protein [Candidatus Micrarchaeota archaeon]